MVKTYAWVFVLIMVMIFPLLANASELFGTIWYKGKPLQNAEITVNNQKIVTNTKGYYSIHIDPGVYRLKVTLPDGRTKEERVNVFSQNTEKNLRLE